MTNSYKIFYIFSESLRYPVVTATKPITNVLYAGECLEANEYLESSNNNFKVIYQSDGDFVLYEKSLLDDNVWSSHTPMSCTNRVCMLANGNFVLYDCKNKILFATNTAGNSGSKMIIQDDGKLAIYKSYDNIIWATRDCCEMQFNSLRQFRF